MASENFYPPRTEQTGSSSTASKPGLTVRHVVLGILLVLFLIVLFFGVRLGIPAWRAIQSLQQLQELVEADSGLAAIPKVRAAANDLADSVTDLEAGIRPLAPALAALRGVPSYGATIAAAPELLVAGRELTALGVEGLDLLAPLARLQPEAEILPALLSLTKNQDQRFQTMAEHSRVAIAALADVPIADLHPALSGRLTTVQPILALLPSVLQTAPGLSMLLGMEEPRSILVLVQNNHELRPTGGFISAVGRVTLDGGRITNLEFTDSYAIFNPRTQYPPPPPAMRKHMGIELLVFRDANWSPDLLTTAQLVRTLYSEDTGQTFDDLVTVDLNAVPLLFDALGPLTIPGATGPVTGANVLEVIKKLWGQPPNSEETINSGNLGEWWLNRKDFIPLLAQAAVDRVQSGSVNVLALLQAGVTALNQRDIQASVSEPHVADVLAQLGWDGALRPDPAADYLALVDTNMGYNKANAVVEPSLSYTVTWPAQGTEPASAEVTIRYTHPAPVINEPCDPTPRYGTSYDEMIDRCYFDYVRLYTPSGSELLDATGVDADSLTSQRGEKGTQVFAGYFVLAPGAEHQVTFRYTLPATIQHDSYQLVIQRQSGTQALPVNLNIAGATLSTTVKDGFLRWSP